LDALEGRPLRVTSPIICKGFSTGFVRGFAGVNIWLTIVLVGD
jgi:hypothetical protein